MKESAILKSLRAAAPYFRARLFRNNVGAADFDDRRIFYGLGKGTSDLIGWHEVIVGPELLGEKLAVFAAVEVKTKNCRATPAQEEFLALVEKAGGVAKIFREGEDIQKFFKQWENRPSKK